MTAPTTTIRAGRVPPGLAELLERIDRYDGPDPLSSRDVAPLFGVTAKTVTSWATSEQLSGLLLSDHLGWRFTRSDLREFITKRYRAAR